MNSNDQNSNKSFEWIETSCRIPDMPAGKFRVRLKNGDEIVAFFYEDAMGWIAFYGKKTSHWWTAHRPYERLDDVTHWMEPAIWPKTSDSINC
jgi:hypothetical protein